MAEALATFIRVEWDADFAGGDYTGVGNLILVPSAAASGDGGVEAAFTAAIGFSPDCIVFYTVDELFDQDGSPIEEDAAHAITA